MTLRVMMVSPAESEALRRSSFENGESLTVRGRSAAEALRARGGPAGAGSARVLLGPSTRCRETAAALGLTGERDPSLAGQSMGSWRGRCLSELMESEPEAVRGWLGDPGHVPAGGASLLALIARVGQRLDGLAADRHSATPDPARMLLVAEPDTVRAAVVHALGLPPQSFWRLDVRPLSVTRLSGRAGRWNLQLGDAPAG